ncbi:MAG: twin-arginine translocase subunit TatC [Desulfotomaculaceae bacterium]|nr:twin-arginine translocase subunit TatC [Desulfotomaculaceae bacterium]
MAEKTDDMPVMEHLEELRRVLVVSAIATLVLAIAAFFFIDQILAILMEPLSRIEQHVSFLGITEPIFVKLKLSFFTGFLAAMPIILWQIWSFVVPALKKNERVAFTTFVLVSFFCFIGGVAFAFFGVFRYGVHFLLQFAGPTLSPMLTIDKYISFTISFLLPFGIVFELPLVSYFLARFELISYAFLAKNRRYAILVSVVIAAVITPTPDIITCLIVSGPMYLLFEFSVFVVRITERRVARRKKRRQMAETADDQPQ